MAQTRETRDTKGIISFLIATFVVTWGLVLIATRVPEALTAMVLSLCMLVPASVAVFIQKLVLKRKLIGDNGLMIRVGNFIWLGLSYAGMLALLFAVYALTFIISPDVFSFDTPVMAQLAATPFAALTPPGTVAALLGIGLTIGLITNCLFYLGEEIGWRGFLTPKLESWFGRRALLITGVIWAVWHTPMIVLLGHNYPDSPWLGHLVWIPTVICLSIIFQSSQLKSGMVFAPAMLHGMLNQVAGVVTMMMMAPDVFNPLLHGMTGLIALIILVPISMILYLRYPYHGAYPGEPDLAEDQISSDAQRNVT